MVCQSNVGGCCRNIWFVLCWGGCCRNMCFVSQMLENVIRNIDQILVNSLHGLLNYEIGVHFYIRLSCYYSRV